LSPTPPHICVNHNSWNVRMMIMIDSKYYTIIIRMYLCFLCCHLFPDPCRCHLFPDPTLSRHMN
jgi:hypothetical protein